MTSEVEALKTNEFHRRRKLRIQQVREQSKDIAKKIRQRANVEKWRHIGELDAKKEQEYLKNQEKFVKRLEEFYVKGLENVGAGHKHASEVNLQEDIPEKTDLSKVRAKEAAAELRRRKQEKLDKQKKVLERKVQAREAANELSRDKSSLVLSKLLTKSTSSKSVGVNINSKVDVASATNLTNDKETNSNNADEVDKPEIVTCDMATQWDFEEMPNEWEPHIPKLSLPKDDQDSIRESNSKNPETKGEKIKRMDLFALSSEMPSSLRGGLSSVPEEQAPPKPSLTLVSEYLQNRGLRLRQFDAPSTSKKPSEDLSGIKQTIMRTRVLKEVSAKGNTEKSTRTLRNQEESGAENALTKKNSVTIYNHSTRDSKNLPCSEKRHVVRDLQTSEDAYSQAINEASSENGKDKEHQNKLQAMRNKIAMTKQNVEKEYKDTMAFLSSLPKDNSKPNKNAYMDQHRQQMEKDKRQRKLQLEYKKIEKEFRRNTHKHPKQRTQEKRQRESKPPGDLDSDDDFNRKDVQYSWMPVPESDGNLAIHTIPTALKEGKSGNSVKFNKVDSYHEYRSRHKHTPPTKDTNIGEKIVKRTIETVVIEPSDTESTNCSSITSDTSFIENLQLDNDKDKKAKGSKEDITLSNAERIIIYKIMDKKSKKSKSKETAKSVGSIDAGGSRSDENKSLNKDVNEQKTAQSVQRISKNTETRVSFEQLNEGVYKTVNEKGDNITSMYFTEGPQERPEVVPEGGDEIEGGGLSCTCAKKPSKDLQSDAGNGSIHWQRGDETSTVRSRHSKEDQKCKCETQTATSDLRIVHPSAATSTASFKTATNVKTGETPDDGFIKLLDDGGHEAGKFFIGASGLLKDDAYEVIIQLRKKDGAHGKEDQKNETEETPTVVQVVKPSDIQQPTVVEPEPARVQQSTDEVNQEPRNSSKANVDVVRESSSTKPDKANNVPSQHGIGNKNNEPPLSCSESSNDVLTEDLIGDANDFVNKGVCTPFQMPHTVSRHLQNTDMEQRPATSTHTQTTPSSPRRRPVFIHMSSSTSTAYMSPPELVLPKFLKNNYKLNYEEINDPTHNSVLEDASVEIVNKEEYCEEYDGCECRRCTHAKKVTLTKIKRPMSGYRRKTHDNNMKTPPNSARSFGSSYQYDVYDVEWKKIGGKPARTAPKIQKTVCHKCESRTGAKTCVKTHALKPKRNISVNKKPSRHHVMRVNSMSASTYRNKLRNEKSFGKPNLNPIVKSYVDKLLALNKEGLKALEVVNQDCSSVTTPGSSIIDVNRNIDTKRPLIETKISLEQIKELLIHQILEKYEKDFKKTERGVSVSTESNNGKKFPRMPRKKSVHKVKSLNISKNLFTTNTDTSEPNNRCSKPHSSPPFKKSIPISPRTKLRSKSSPSPRRVDAKVDKSGDKKTNLRSDREFNLVKNAVLLPERQERDKPFRQSHRTTVTSSDSEANGILFHQKLHPPSNISTQTSRTIDEEINFMKMAEDKLQNMEKIADLTEKCTIRLSNLAKVLEEVRRNKTLAYSQISDSASDSERKSDKISTEDKPQVPYDPSYEINVEIKKRIRSPPPTQTVNEDNKTRASEYNPFLLDLKEGRRNRSSDCNSNSVSTDSDPKSDRSTTNNKSPLVYDPIEQTMEVKNGITQPEQSIEERVQAGKDFIDNSKYTPFLSDIPKPDVFKAPAPPLNVPAAAENSNIRYQNNESLEHSNLRRGKPPPALSRINLKHGRDIVVPHELSTVIEVDSPMSAKVKNQSTQNETTLEPVQEPSRSNKETQNDVAINNQLNKDQYVNPDLLQSNISLSRRQTNMFTDSSDDSKLQMMDLNKFNEIMLKPFISIREYAKQCNVESLDEGSNLDDIARDDVINDDLSSLHSDASLPDVIAELLKRNIISEPFKFDTVSNVNSTTISSESTLSLLALSNVRKGKKKAVMFQSKENAAETSDTLSISSNPDLENAFKKLGMGWASSTLKKTKERLALSSSSNTSSSSLSQIKVPSTSNPAIATDSASSALAVSNKSLQRNDQQKKPTNTRSLNVEQQTSKPQSMTVNDFLTNELSKKITFTNKSHRNDTDEFVSLYETKMPEDMKHSLPMMRGERSMDSCLSGSNNRARTSTPVQIFKSMAYHSSSSSNMSNGLFSNADDLSSVKGTSNSMRNHSTSDKDDLTIPNYSLRMRKDISDCSKSD